MRRIRIRKSTWNWGLYGGAGLFSFYDRLRLFSKALIKKVNKPGTVGSQVESLSTIQNKCSPTPHLPTRKNAFAFICKFLFLKFALTRLKILCFRINKKTYHCAAAHFLNLSWSRTFKPVPTKKGPSSATLAGGISKSRQNRTSSANVTPSLCQNRPEQNC